MDTKVLNEHLLTDIEKQEEIEIIKQKEKDLNGGKLDTSGLTEEEKTKLSDSSLNSSGEMENKKETEDKTEKGDPKVLSKNTPNNAGDPSTGELNSHSK